MAAPRSQIWLVKGMWRSTAVLLKVPAYHEDDAWDQASKRIRKMEGGVKCLDIKVLRRLV